jgi:DNA-binding NarL/FixJ family response regulator
MRAFYEKLGVLGPIYRLVGKGFSDREIAGQLRLSELVVTNCIAWMLHSFKVTDRGKLVADAFSAAQPSTSEAHLRAS